MIDDEREATKGPGAVMSGSMAHFDYFDTCSDEHKAKHKCNQMMSTKQGPGAAIMSGKQGTVR